MRKKIELGQEKVRMSQKKKKKGLVWFVPKLKPIISDFHQLHFSVN